MTNLHDENFYFYQNNLLDESNFRDLVNATPITRGPNQPGGPFPWVGGVASSRGGALRMRRRNDTARKSHKPWRSSTPWSAQNPDPAT
jgi:hypothetical protein